VTQDDGIDRSQPAARLWMVDVARNGAALRELERAYPRLSPADEIRFDGYGHDPVRAAHRNAHIALRTALEHVGGHGFRRRPFEIGPHGQRRMPADFEGAFSLAHTGDLALIGWTRTGYIGVDLEQRRSVRLKGHRRAVIERAAHGLSGRASVLERLDDADARFLQSWVRLESLAKADGRGLAALFTHLGVSSSVVPSQADCALAAQSYARARAVVVHDLDVGADRFAAAALPALTQAPPIAWLEF
jgi:phosphopantetheinyl transferase